MIKSAHLTAAISVSCLFESMPGVKSRQERLIQTIISEKLISNQFPVIKIKHINILFMHAARQ